MIGVLWLVAAWAGCEDRSAAESQAVSDALTNLVLRARAAQDPSDIVARVRKLVDDDGLCTDGQRLNAAYVLLEGEPDDLRLAHDLARTVYENGANPSAGPTAARAWDSALVREGKRQDYGLVQGTKGSSKCLYSVSEAKSDEDRAALGVEPLQTLLDAFAAGAGADTPASLDALEEADLLCDLNRVVDEGPTEVSIAYQVQEERPRRVEVEDNQPGTIPRNAQDLTYGELYGSMAYWSGNAYTVRKGTFLLRPFRRSAYGITDHVQVGSALLGWIYAFPDAGRHGANAFVEMAPFAGQKGAVSRELGGVLPWRSLGDGPVVHAESALKRTVRVSDTTALTLGAYGGLSHYGDRATELQVDPLVYDLQAKFAADISLGRSTMFVVSVRNDVDAWWQQQVFAWGTGLHVAYARNALGVSTGVSVERPAGLATAASAANDAGLPLGVASMLVVPVPQIQLWARM